MNLDIANRGPRFARFLSVLLLTASAAGQAWVPEKGEGSFSTSYNYMNFKGHLGGEGKREPEAASRAQNVVFDVEYGVTDKLAVSFSLPIVTTRYNSTNPPSAVLRTLFSQTLQAIAP